MVVSLPFCVKQPTMNHSAEYTVHVDSRLSISVVTCSCLNHVTKYSMIVTKTEYVNVLQKCSDACIYLDKRVQSNLLNIVLECNELIFIPEIINN